jgi:hypothetical protein
MRRTHATVAVLCVLASVFATGAATASAAAPIEGIWSFNGGEVGIQRQSDGTFTGIVVAPTKFSQCLHPTGEQVWTQINEQPDGSYFGLHQWYFETSNCVANPTLGLTAWRVLSTESGQRFLRVCFSEPGSSPQPEIAASGDTTGATFGCQDSQRVSALPELSPTDLERYLTLPSNGACYSRPKMRVRAVDPPSDPIEKFGVRLRSGKIHRQAKLKRRTSHITATLNLKGLSAPRFAVRIHLRTVLGEELTLKRVFRRCATPARLHHVR